MITQIEITSENSLNENPINEFFQGKIVDHNGSLQYISIENLRGETLYYAQGESYEELENEANNYSKYYNIPEEEALLVALFEVCRDLE